MEKCWGGQFSVYMYKAISSKRISLDLEALQLVNTDFPGEKAKEKKGSKTKSQCPPDYYESLQCLDGWQEVK